MAVIHGAPGVGKTFLLERFAREARAVGVAVREATGVPTERNVPLGLVKQLFGDDEIVRNADAEGPLETAHCCDVEVARLCGPCQSLASRMYALIEESLRLFDGTSPMALIVDDVYLADSPSLWVLRSLLYRLRRLPVLLVISGCYATTSRQLRDFRFDLMKNSSLLSLELSHFTSCEATKLIRQATGSRPTAAYMKGVMELTGGNARLLAAVAYDMKMLPERKHSPEQVPYRGTGLREAVRLMLCNSHVANLERVARAMAVLGGGVPVTLFSALSRVEPTGTADAVELLKNIGLTSGGEFRHPAIRAAILEDPAFKERGVFHRSAARLLHQRGASAREVAECIVAAGVATEAWEMAVLREAARHAQAEGEWHEAVGCLELARISLGEPGEQAEALLEAARAKWRVNAHAALSHLPELVVHARRGRLSGCGSLSVSAMLTWVGRQAEANYILGLLSDSDRAVLGGARSLLEGPEAALQQAMAPNPSLVGPEHTTAPAVPWRCDETAAVVDTARDRTSAEFIPSEQMIRSYFLDPEWVNWPMDIGCFTPRLLHHVCLALPDIPCVDGLADDDCARMSPFRRMILHCLQAVNAQTRGHPAKAEREARSALVQSASWGIYVGLPLSVLILSQVQQGKFEEGESTLRRPMPAEFFESEFGRLYVHSRGVYRIAVGMPYSALGDFLACGEIEKRLVIPSVATCPWRAQAAYAYLLLDRKEEAIRAARDVVATSGGVWAKAIALRVLALTRPVERRADLLRDAVGLLEGSVYRIELATNLCELGRTQYALGHAKAARVLMRRAWSMARFARFEPLLRAISSNEAPSALRQDPDASAEPPAKTASLLSSAERRVAWLAGIGHSNREVAARLCITVSTVEQHLTKIYRKLGLKRREDLVTAVPVPPDGILR
ncbi:AAA family ATPase [Streptomyces sp. NA02950]|nr:AAA family ATPase [Streptomyces sp. NA02950]